MKTVLVTGGAGFIGSHVVENLLGTGYRVRVFDNLSSGHMENIPQYHEQLEFIEGTIVNKELVEKACRGVEAVVHLAALVSVPLSITNPEQSAATNVTGFLNVLNCLKGQGFNGRFIYASSSAVYGGAGQAQSLREDDAPGILISPYALDKYMNEQYAELYARLYGLKTLGFRFFNVYGPRQDPSSQYSGVISIFMDRALAGRNITIYGDGYQTRDFVYVGDLAKILCGALKDGSSGVLNLGTGVAVTVNELAEKVKQVTNVELEVDYQPKREGDILNSCANIGRLRQQLNSEPATSLEEGLEILKVSLG